MAETKTLNVRFQQKIDTAANWADSDLVLMAGEIAIESDTRKFKFGDGEHVFSELDYAGIDQDQLDAIEDNYYHVVPTGEETDMQAIGRVVTTPKKGDIAVCERVIGGVSTASSMTAYMYSGENWCALDGNYDASNVYFDSNLVMTANIGVQTLGSASSKELGTQGKSLKQVLSMILAKEEKPGNPTQPAVTTKIGNGTSSTPHASNAITVEGGTTITPKWEASLSAGSYTYGPATGITATAWDVKGYLGSNAVSGHSSTSNSGTFSNLVLGAGQSYKITAKATHGDGPLAYTNLGEEYKAGNALFDSTSGATSVQIKGGDSNKKSDDSPTISAWQQGYYIGTLESDVEITSDLLRNADGKGTLKNRKTKGGNYAAATDLAFSPSGTMAKFVVAYPASIDTNADGSAKENKGMTSFFNNSSFEEYMGNFTKSTVKVAGADNDLTSSHAINYTVWTWVPASAFTGSINFLIDLKA